MSLYGELAAVADELLAEFGQEIILYASMPGGYNPATGQSSATDAGYYGRGAAFDFNFRDSGQTFGAGTLIQAGDRQLYLSPVGVPAPKPGDLVDLADGSRWNVAAVKTTDPSSAEPVIFECLLRR